MSQAPETQNEKPWGEQVSQAYHREGICRPDDVMSLISECWVVDGDGNPFASASFPFQGFADRHNGKWVLRIEPAASHVVNGSAVYGHRWAFSLAAGDANPNR